MIKLTPLERAQQLAQYRQEMATQTPSRLSPQQLDNTIRTTFSERPLAEVKS